MATWNELSKILAIISTDVTVVNSKREGAFLYNGSNLAGRTTTMSTKAAEPVGAVVGANETPPVVDSKDPVYSRSSFLSTYMSGHKDTLVAYVLHYGQVQEPVSTARMDRITSNEMVLSYQKNGQGKWDKISVKFDPPLSGYNEVKPRLLQMKVDAEEALGMAKAPHLTTFSLSLSAFRVVPLLLILLIATLAPYEPCSFTKETTPGFLHPLLSSLNEVCDNISHARQSLSFTPYTAQFVWACIIVIHTILAILVASFCHYRRSGFKLATAWALSTFILSVPAVFELRSNLQAARIKSIGKTH